MRLAARSHLTAGVALVGASAIALAPITIPPSPPGAAAPPVPAVATPFALTTATNLFEALADLVANTGSGLEATADNFLANPFPIIRQIVENQFANLHYAGNAIGEVLAFLPSGLEQVGGYVEAFFEDIREGDFISAGQQITAGVVTLFAPFFIPITVPFQIGNHVIQNLAAAAQAFTNNMVLTLFSVMNPFNAFITSGAEIAQTVFASLEAGNIGDAIGAVLSAPIVQLDAILNGYTAESGQFTPGLLTVGTNPFANGPIAALLNLARAVADAMTPIPIPGQQSLAATASDSTDSPDKTDPAATGLTDAPTITVLLENSSAGEIILADSSTEESAEATTDPTAAPPVEPVDEVPVTEVVPDADEEETPTPTDEDEEPMPVEDGTLEPEDEDPGDGDSGLDETGDDSEETGEGDGESGDGGSTAAGGTSGEA
ncbi:hypothetical protein [Mycobacterium sp. NAZ190054]|uniref:hypothetical protein n=1 Tax=Mycobacterium sp. NAZ190054 TaxID=1747766 RepID=UPI000A53C0BC|nr:hypothetical protein [Mycobacterium sp. NAZ190054]